MKYCFSSGQRAATQERDIGDIAESSPKPLTQRARASRKANKTLCFSRKHAGKNMQGAQYRNWQSCAFCKKWTLLLNPLGISYILNKKCSKG